MLVVVPSDDLATLLRWVEAGGTWRLSRSDGATVEIGLTTCTGETVMDALRSSAPDVLAYVEAATADDSRD